MAECAEERGGEGAGTGGLDSAQGHAGVFGFDHDPDTFGFEMGVQSVGDLLGQAFLDLRAKGEVFDDRASLDRPRMRLPGR